jgi:hypothetical protein
MFFISLAADSFFNISRVCFFKFREFALCLVRLSACVPALFSGGNVANKFVIADLNNFRHAREGGHPMLLKKNKWDPRLRGGDAVSKLLLMSIVLHAALLTGAVRQSYAGAISGFRIKSKIKPCLIRHNKLTQSLWRVIDGWLNIAAGTADRARYCRY